MILYQDFYFTIGIAQKGEYYDGIIPFNLSQNTGYLLTPYGKRNMSTQMAIYLAQKASDNNFTPFKFI